MVSLKKDVYDVDEHEDDSEYEVVRPARKRAASVIQMGSDQSPPTVQNPSPTKRARPQRVYQDDDDINFDQERHGGQAFTTQPRRLDFEGVEDPSATFLDDEDEEEERSRPKRLRPTEKALYKEEEIDTFKDQGQNGDDSNTGPLTRTRARPVGAKQRLTGGSIRNALPYKVVDGLLIDEDGYVIDSAHNQPPPSAKSLGRPLPIGMSVGSVTYSTGSKNPSKGKQLAVPRHTHEDDDDEVPTNVNLRQNSKNLNHLADDYVPETPPRRDTRPQEDSAVKRMGAMSVLEGGSPSESRNRSTTPELPTTQIFLEDIDTRAKARKLATALAAATRSHSVAPAGSLDLFVRPSTAQGQRARAAGSAVAPVSAGGSSVPAEPLTPPVQPPNSPARRSNTAADAALAAAMAATHTPAMDVVFTLESRDTTRDVSNCPEEFLVMNEDGTTSPAEIPVEVFTALEGDGKETFLGFIIFRTLAPFVSAGRIPLEVSLKKGQFVWPNERSAIFALPGTVISCNVLAPATIGSFEQREIRIVPYGNHMRALMARIGPLMKAELKTQGTVFHGPFDYGCMLTLSGRRNGFFASESSTGAVAPVGIKKSYFSSSRKGASQDWFEGKLPNCVDFDKRIPLYDGAAKPFHFERSDFAEMPHHPLYKENGRLAEIPPNSAIIVFFSLAVWRDKKGQDCLSFNLQYALNLGIPVMDD